MLVFHGLGAKARVHIIRERTLAGLAAARRRVVETSTTSSSGTP